MVLKNRESGFVTSDVILVLCAISILLLSLHMFVSSAVTNAKVYKNYYESRQKAKDLLEKILADMQELKFDDADFFDSVTIYNIERKYYENSLVIKDCSSGINTKFFKEDFLMNEKTVSLMSYKGESVLKDYGYINKKWSDEKTREDCKRELGEKAGLLINTLPLVNIYMCDLELVDLMAQYCGITDYEDKKNNLYEMIYLKDFTRENAVNKIGLNHNSAFFDVFGIKTTFWKITFSTEVNKVMAVAAGIPGEDGKIKEYRLVELHIEKK